MSGELFDIPESLSPKLRWLRDHGLVTVRQESGRWLCVLTDETVGRGDDEEAACVDFAMRHKLPHWLEEAE